MKKTHMLILALLALILIGFVISRRGQTSTPQSTTTTKTTKTVVVSNPTHYYGSINNTAPYYNPYKAQYYN